MKSPRAHAAAASAAAAAEAAGTGAGPSGPASQEPAGSVPAGLPPDQSARLPEGGKDSAVQDWAPQEPTVGLDAASKAVGISVAKLRRLRDAGAIRSRKLEDGTHVFDRADLEALRERLAAEAPDPDEPTEGERAAVAFAFFNDGKPPWEVVVLMKETPDLIRSLYAEWTAMHGDLVVRSDFRVAIGTAVGVAVVTVQDLVKAIRELVADRNELRRFLYPCSVCRKPIQASSELTWRWLLDQGALGRWKHTTCRPPETAPEDDE